MLLLGAVLGGMLLALLDQTIVSTALPGITDDLGGAAQYGWVVTAYLLSITASGPLYGRLSDRYGRRPLLLTGLGIFLTGSAMCAAATTMPILIACRAVQGLGAGALMPLCLALAAEMFPPEQRARVHGALGAVLAVSYIAGPLAGGWLTDHAGWRWIFLVNLPLGVIIMVLILLRLPTRLTINPRVHPDYLGIALFTGAISALLIGLTDGGHPAPLIIAALLAPLFIVVELRAEEPLIPLILFRQRAYIATSLASFGGAFALYSTVIYLPRYFQLVRRVSATDSGLRIYPLLLAMVAGSIATGLLIARTGRHRPWLAAGAILLGCGALLMHNLTAETPTAILAVWMLLVGIGLGPTLSGLTVAIQNAVPPAYLGAATSNLGLFRQLGGAVTLALAARISDSPSTVVSWLATTGAVMILLATSAMPSASKPVSVLNPQKECLTPFGGRTSSTPDHLSARRSGPPDSR
jgi:EmrB/QacA subfamily drug resistance transporter